MPLPDLSPEDHNEIKRLEEAMWTQSTRFELKFQESRFAEDFLEFGRSGRIYQRHQIIRTDAQEIKATLPFAEFAIRVLDINTVHVTYNSEVIYDGVVEYARRSSIWSRTETGWVMRFHQGTPYVPEIAKTQAIALVAD